MHHKEVQAHSYLVHQHQRLHATELQCHHYEQMTLITNNYTMAYADKENNLELNIKETKGLIVDFGQRGVHAKTQCQHYLILQIAETEGGGFIWQ